MGFIRKNTVGHIPRRLIPKDRMQVLSLLSRQPDSTTSSTYAAAIAWQARRKPADLELIGAIGGDIRANWVDFELFQVDGQTAPPLQEDRLIDANGFGYDIKLVRDIQFQVIWPCHVICCTQPPPAIPGSFVISAISGGFSATWTAPATQGSLAYYQLQWSIDGQTWNALANPSASATSASTGALVSGLKLQARLQAFDNLGQFGGWAVAGPITTLQPPLLKNLVSFWPFNGNLADVVGSNLLTAPNGESFTAGLIGNAVVLNGTNQYLQAPTQALPGEFWFGGWVNVASVVANARVFDWGSGTSDYTYLTLSNSDGKALVHFNGPVSQQLGCGVATPTNQWTRYDVGLLNNGNLIVICKDGVMRAAAIPSGQIVPASGANNWFGQSQYYALGDPYLGGNLNQWGLWSRGLSLKELINLYAQGNGYAYPFNGPQTTAYIFASWLDSSNGTGPLYLLTSYDTVNWQQQYSSYTPPGGDLIRDVALAQLSSINWWIAHTAQSSSSSYFDVAQSTTCGLTFGSPVQVSCAEISPTFVYAPRWTQDNNGVWGVLFAAKVSGSWGVYFKTPTTPNAFGGAWNDAYQITGTFASGGAGGGPLDPALVPPSLSPSGLWCIWTKSIGNQLCGYSTSSAFSGPYTYQGDISGIGEVDGPTPVKLSDRWRLFVDDISGGNPVGEQYFDSFDGWETWSESGTNLSCTLLSGSVTTGLGHGTITTLV